MGGFKLKYEAKSSDNLVLAEAEAAACLGASNSQPMKSRESKSGVSGGSEKCGTTGREIFVGVGEAVMARLVGPTANDSRNLAALDLHGFEESVLSASSEKLFNPKDRARDVV
jgi:hypothetical protein